MALTNKGCFKINNVEFTAKNITQTTESLTTKNSGRTLNGRMHISWLRPKIRKWEIEMPPCTAQEAYNIMSLVQGQSYRIEVFDLNTNDFITLDVYTENTTSDCYSGIILNGLYVGLTFTANEF